MKPANTHTATTASKVSATGPRGPRTVSSVGAITSGNLDSADPPCRSFAGTTRVIRTEDDHTPRTSGHGWLRASCIVQGIMLSLRWYMIQIEPLSVITTSTTEN